MTSKPPCILVVGGAGFIGSHMVWLLGQKGAEVVTLDNLSSGHRDAVLHGDVVHGDIADRLVQDTIFRRYRFDAVMNFASCIQAV
ncbi:MAG: NAD-dependent epimerase/dehydratase family protein [Thermodesulfobacteriota bacterium]